MSENYGHASPRRPVHMEPGYHYSEQEREDRKCKGLHLKPIALLCVLAVFLCVGIVKHKAVASFLGRFMVECAKLGLWAPLIVLVLTAVLSVFMLPTFPLMVGGGVEFTKMYGIYVGSALGIASSFGGLWLGSILAFQLGRTLCRELGESSHGESTLFKVINAMIDEEGVKIVFFARMSPLLPAEVFNYACSVTKLTLWQYALGCLGSVVPTAIWVVSAASATNAAGGKRHQVWSNVVLIGINLLVLVALTAMLYHAYHRYKTKSAANALFPSNDHSPDPVTGDARHVAEMNNILDDVQ